MFGNPHTLFKWVLALPSLHHVLKCIKIHIQIKLNNAASYHLKYSLCYSVQAKYSEAANQRSLAEQRVPPALSVAVAAGLGWSLLAACSQGTQNAYLGGKV